MALPFSSSNQLTGGRQTQGAGVVDTADIGARRLRIDMDPKIHLLDANKAPLVALTSQLPKRATIQPRFDWNEDDFTARFDTASDANAPGGTNLAGDTVLGVTDASIYRIADVVKVPVTEEVMRVTAIDTGANTITVVRSIGSTAAADITNGVELLIIGNALEEGAGAPATILTRKTNQFNFTQIFKNIAVDVTRTLNSSQLNTQESEMAYQQSKTAIEHSIDIERAFLYGEKSEDLSGSEPRRTTGGVLEFIATNVFDAGGADLPEADFNVFLQDGFRFGSESKLLLASPNLARAIDGYGRDKLRTVPREETFGIAVRRYISSFGVVNLVVHHLLEGVTFNGHGILLDVEDLIQHPLDDTFLKTNIQNNDQDKRRDMFVTETGLQLINEQRHAVLKGVTG